MRVSATQKDSVPTPKIVTRAVVWMRSYKSRARRIQVVRPSAPQESRTMATPAPALTSYGPAQRTAQCASMRGWTPIFGKPRTKKQRKCARARRARSAEADDAARDLALFHRLEGGVDVLERMVREISSSIFRRLRM